MELGPITKAYLEAPLDKQVLKTKSGRFRQDCVIEIRRSLQHRETYAGIAPIFTMREEEYRGLVSLKQIYMTSIDEYDCAMRAFGSWDHWLLLLKREDFTKGYENSIVPWTGVFKWREEKRILEQHQAKKVLLELSAKGNFAATKVLFDNSSDKHEPGRPTKEKVLEKLTAEVQKEKQAELDMKRIRLAINNDKKVPSSAERN